LPLRNGGGFYDIVVAGENLENRNLVYLNALGEWVKADTSSWDMMPVVGITLGNITSGRRGSVLFDGYVGNASWAWTPGEELFCSSDGTVTSTAPLEARQRIGWAITSTLILLKREPLENIINWSNDLRNIYCHTRDLRCIQERKGDDWWTLDAHPAETKIDNFSSVMDLSGIPLSTLIASTPWYAAKVGAGTFLANEGTMQGMRITTGATTNNDNLLTDGDTTGTKRIWNITQYPTLHIHYRVPEVGDAGNMAFFIIFWEDANNYIGLRYDTNVDNKLRFVTKDGAGAGNEETTDLGTLDTDWHELNVKVLVTSVKFIIDGGTTYTHTTHIPNGNMASYIYLKTLENVAKKMDVSHLAITQKHV